MLPWQGVPSASMSPRAAALVFLCTAALLRLTAGHCASLAPFTAASSLQYPHACHAERGWRALRALWTPVDVVVNCTTSSYTVVTAMTEQQLRSEVDLTPVKWCGLQHLVSEPAVCRFSLSPLQDSYLAVRATEASGLFGKGGPAELACHVHSSQEFSALRLAVTAAGVLLFFNAASLSMSTTFRLTSGSLMFMSGAVVVLTFMFMRSVPYKRSMVAFFTLSSTSMMAVVRWLYGTWLPDMHTLLLSRPFLLYMLITGLLGLAVTYWMDDTSNVKINTTIRVTLQLVGGLLVYLGFSDEWVAMGVMALIAGSGWVAAVTRRLVMLAWLPVKYTALLLRWLLRSTWRLVWRNSRSLASAAAAAPAALARAAGRARTDRLDAAPAGSPLSEHAAGHAAEPLLSDEEEEQQTASKRRQQQRRRTWQRAAQQQQDFEQEEEQQQHRSPLLDKVGSFRDWAAPRAGTTRGGERSPLHLKQGPPLSPSVLAVQPDLRQHHWRQQDVPIGQQAAASPAAAAGYDVEGYRFPSTAPRQSSPWSQERLVMSVSNRQVASPPLAPQLSPALPAASPAAAAGQGSISPLVQQGKIVNPLTNKVIAINKPTYNLLISQGYTPDLVDGVLLPPGNDAAASAAAAGTQQAGVVASSAGRGVTAGSQVRQRPGRARSGAVATPRSG